MYTIVIKNGGVVDNDGNVAHTDTQPTAKWFRERIAINIPNIDVVSQLPYIMLKRDDDKDGAKHELYTGDATAVLLLNNGTKQLVPQNTSVAYDKIVFDDVIVRRAAAMCSGHAGSAQRRAWPSTKFGDTWAQVPQLNPTSVVREFDLEDAATVGDIISAVDDIYSGIEHITKPRPQLPQLNEVQDALLNEIEQSHQLVPMDADNDALTAAFENTQNIMLMKELNRQAQSQYNKKFIDLAREQQLLLLRNAMDPQQNQEQCPHTQLTNLTERYEQYAVEGQNEAHCRLCGVHFYEITMETMQFSDIMKQFSNAQTTMNGITTNNITKIAYKGIDTMMKSVKLSDAWLTRVPNIIESILPHVMAMLEDEPYFKNKLTIDDLFMAYDMYSVFYAYIIAVKMCITFPKFFTFHNMSETSDLDVVGGHALAMFLETETTKALQISGINSMRIRKEFLRMLHKHITADDKTSVYNVPAFDIARVDAMRPVVSYEQLLKNADNDDATTMTIAAVMTNASPQLVSVGSIGIAEPYNADTVDYRQILCPDGPLHVPTKVGSAVAFNGWKCMRCSEVYGLPAATYDSDESKRRYDAYVLTERQRMVWLYFDKTCPASKAMRPHSLPCKDCGRGAVPTKLDKFYNKYAKVYDAAITREHVDAAPTTRDIVDTFKIVDEFPYETTDKMIEAVAALQTRKPFGGKNKTLSLKKLGWAFMTDEHNMMSDDAVVVSGSPSVVSALYDVRTNNLLSHIGYLVRNYRVEMPEPRPNNHTMASKYSEYVFMYLCLQLINLQPDEYDAAIKHISTDELHNARRVYSMMALAGAAAASVDINIDTIVDGVTHEYDDEPKMYSVENDEFDIVKHFDVENPEEIWDLD